MTPTVPEFKAFKGFADISQSLEVIDKLPLCRPREKSGKKCKFGKRENAEIRANCGKSGRASDSKPEIHYTC